MATDGENVNQDKTRQRRYEESDSDADAEMLGIVRNLVENVFEKSKLIPFLDDAVKAALAGARAQGVAAERERIAKLAEAEAQKLIDEAAQASLVTGCQDVALECERTAAAFRAFVATFSNDSLPTTSAKPSSLDEAIGRWMAAPAAERAMVLGFIGNGAKRADTEGLRDLANAARDGLMILANIGRRS